MCKHILIGISTALFFSLIFIPGLSSPNTCSHLASHSKLIPSDAQFFYLNVSNPNFGFSLAQFTPDQSFIGYYNVQIACLLFVDSYDPNCTVICRNLWNASDSPNSKLTGDIPHSTYSYSYSRPTGSDPDFAVCLILSAGTPIQMPPVEGWVCLRVTHGGTTTPPSNFIMPGHLANCTTNSVSSGTITITSSCTITDSGSHSTSSSDTNTSSNNSSETRSVSFWFISSIISLSLLLAWKKRKRLEIS